MEDYAAWSAMYQYVQHPTPSFTDSNFTSDSAANLHVDLVMVLDNSGTVIYGHSFGKGAAQPGLLESLSAWIGLHHSRVPIPDKTGTAEGIIGLRQGLLIMAARPIMDDLRTQPVAGTLVMCRLLDAEAVAKMGSQILITLAVYGVDEPTVPDAVRRAKPRLAADSTVYIDTRLNMIASVFATLRDMDDNPAAIVQIDSPRDIRMQGVWTVRYFFLWLLFIGAGFGGVVLLTLERTVLSRLVHLGKSVLAIGTGGTPPGGSPSAAPTRSPTSARRSTGCSTTWHDPRRSFATASSARRRSSMRCRTRYSG